MGDWVFPFPFCTRLVQSIIADQKGRQIIFGIISFGGSLTFSILHINVTCSLKAFLVIINALKVHEQDFFFKHITDIHKIITVLFWQNAHFCVTFDYSLSKKFIWESQPLIYVTSEQDYPNSGTPGFNDIDNFTTI